MIVTAGTAAAPTYRLDVTSRARFDGKLVIGYRLSNAFGKSATALVTVTVKARPDLSADPVVRGLSDAQAETARRFGRTQADNFMRRTEQLHGVGKTNRNSFTTRLAFDALIHREPLIDQPSTDPADLVARRARGLPVSMIGDEAHSAAWPSEEGAKLPVAQGRRPDGRIAFWSGGSVQVGTRDQTTRRAKLNVASIGISGGADMRIGERLTIGIGGGYGADATKVADGAARVRANNKIGAAYFSATPVDGSFIDAIVGYGDLDFRTRRNAANSATAHGTRDGSLLLGTVSGGIDRHDGAFAWSVYGRGIYTRAVLDAYVEHGAGLYDLRFDQRNLSSLSSVLGLKLGLRQPIAIGTVTPWLRGEWTHEFQGAGEQRLDYADVAGGAFYGISTQGWRREQFQLSFGSDLELPSAWSLGVEIGAQAAQKERSGTVRVKVGKEF